eukprot:361248-Chlamydomonas_euryale.AAC.2
MRSAAEDARDAARARLKASMDKIKKSRAGAEAAAAAQQAARRAAVMGLKGSLTAVREDVAAKARLHQQKQKQKREVHEKQFQDLLEQVSVGGCSGLVGLPNDCGGWCVCQRALAQSLLWNTPSSTKQAFDCNTAAE